MGPGAVQILFLILRAVVDIEKGAVGEVVDKNNLENKSKAAFEYENVPHMLGGDLETRRYQRDELNLEDYSISSFICGKRKGPWL